MENNIYKFLIKWVRRIYTITFNIYAWFWLYRMVFIRESYFEDYLLWFFATAGMYFFVLDGKDVFLLDKGHRAYNNIER